MSRKSPEKPTFTLVAPHYHNGWAYDFVAKELRRLGYDSLQIDLPIGDASATIDQHAAEVRRQEREKGASSYIEVGSSWGGDLIYRQLGGVPVQSLVFLATPLRPLFRENGMAEIWPEFENLPSVRYQAVVEGYENGESDFPREELSDIFYNDSVKPAIKEWAQERIEPHPHVEGKDTNARLPEGVGRYYVGMLSDKVFSFERQKATARWMKTKIIPFPSGHIPMVEQPELLAELLVQIAENNIDWDQWGELGERFRLEKLARVPIQL